MERPVMADAGPSLLFVAASTAGAHILFRGRSGLDIHLIIPEWPDGRSSADRCTLAPRFTLDLSAVCDPSSPAPTMPLGRGYGVTGWQGAVAEVTPLLRQPWWPVRGPMLLRLNDAEVTGATGLVDLALTVSDSGWFDGAYNVPLLLVDPAKGDRDALACAWSGGVPQMEVVPAAPLHRGQALDFTIGAGSSGEAFLALTPNEVDGAGFGPAAQLHTMRVSADQGATVAMLGCGLWRITTPKPGTAVTLDQLPTQQRPGKGRLTVVDPASYAGGVSTLRFAKVSASFAPQIEVQSESSGEVTVKWSVTGANKVVLSSDAAWRTAPNGAIGVVTTSASATFSIETACTFIVTGMSQSMGTILSAQTTYKPMYDVLQASAAPLMIVPWHGSAASPPSGWAFCDGSTYTGSDGAQHVAPDLRNRFIIGAGEIPQGTTYSGDSHQHDFSFGVTLQSGGAHHHDFPTAWTLNTTTSPSSHTDRDHYYAIVSQSKSTTCTNHTHSFALDSATAPMVALPNYYALCYIVKK